MSAPSIVNSLAKVFDHNAVKSQGPTTTAGATKKQPVVAHSNSSENFNILDIKLDNLNRKVDKSLIFQEKLLQKLDNLCQEVGFLESDVETLKGKKKELGQGYQRKEVASMPGMKELYTEMFDMLVTLNKNAEQQFKKLDGVQKLVLGVQQLTNFLAKTFKNSRIAEFILSDQIPSKQGSHTKGLKKTQIKKTNDCTPTDRWHSILNKRNERRKDHKVKNQKEKAQLSLNGLKLKKKKKPPDLTDGSNKETLLVSSANSVNKLNKENSMKLSSLFAQENVSEPQCQELDKVLEKESEVSLREQNNELKLDVSREDAAALDKATTGKLEKAVPTAEEGDTEIEAEEDEEYFLEEMGEETVVEAETEEEHTEDEEVMEEMKAEEISDGEKEAEETEQETETEERMKEYSPDVVEQATPCLLEDSNKKAVDNESRPPDIQNELNQNLQQKYKEIEKETSALRVATTEPEPEPAGDLSQNIDHSISSKRRVTEEDLVKDDNKKSRRDSSIEGYGPPEEPNQSSCVTEGTLEPSSNIDEENNNQVVPTIEDLEIEIDDSPPPPAPFDHRIVSAKPAQINNYFSIDRTDILGGGRFGQVHKCMEKSTGLTLAAKIIKVRGAKEKEEVKNEIQVMNQLNHVNLIQLYAAFESKNDIALVMEYVEGGELFDRIIDENYNLTEMDTVLFIKQICEGVQYMHQMYILHLDLKPENILCISRSERKIKIIDFGLARRYKPREKLKVNFGTPEFLAPEVVNYDFVSFPTDMWSMGVIAYMLLSGLSPFLGEDDSETLNNILACKWDFEDPEFQNVSEDAKEFISKLLIKEKTGRISAAQCLKEPWLANISEKAKKCKVCLKSQILLQKCMVQQLWKKSVHAVVASNLFRKTANRAAFTSIVTQSLTLNGPRQSYPQEQ
ncbi:myosin light chain kinase 2, skeletal/cardiac muscle isoform X3 [Latimeria chalumnae]|uniref:myosin light chain kinase 2, skeletal/cardiac muscle isoform X3 n=1 Tax=Latimeria chalumnae TaxID=7897 RepID=UPI0003C10E7B|nr:PREDICTED: myosin light chain kinase 2, skeletal/cardiac muscle-like isoform X1 [Latimeria chalumnae]|eukprot:XP_006008083.1 PREDICTED: myosin light chain kinase 2, skeletal/cardiac muscle-like isoform X1 [Latimeria chalumnae]